jgi:hypothetical protein
VRNRGASISISHWGLLFSFLQENKAEIRTENKRKRFFKVLFCLGCKDGKCLPFSVYVL